MATPPTKEFFAESQTFAQTMIDDIFKAVSPFHSIDMVKEVLGAQGFEELKESEKWTLEASKKYYFTRNGTTVCSFVTGATVAETGVECFKAVGTHTDSPCIRIAPISYAPRFGYEQVAIQTYGGVLLHTWLDRPLSLAGRVIVKNAQGALEARLWRHDEPICQIPNLAIHLQTERGRFTWNTDQTFRPIFATTVIDDLMSEGKPDSLKGIGYRTDEQPLNVQGPYSSSMDKKHMYTLLKLIADELSVTIDDIVDFDLSFFDVTPPQLVGLHKEFTSCPRLDNMMGTTVATHAMAEQSANIPTDGSVNILFSYDHEEVGSQSYQGAAGTMANDAMQRIFNAFIPGGAITPSTVEDFKTCMKRSLFCSADNWHSNNPNYSEYLQENHKPQLNHGMLIHIDVNQDFTTDAASAAIVGTIADMAGVPIQEANGVPGIRSGSTIGPHIGANLGMKVIDLGCSNLAMHSIREMGGVVDTLYYKNFFKQFWQSYVDVRSNILFN